MSIRTMLIMIYGEDSFRVQEKVQQMKQAFLEKFDGSGMNLAEFPSKENDKLESADILQAICSYPFLGLKRLVIVRGLIGSVKKADEAIWLDGMSRMPDSTITILWEDGSSQSVQKKKFFQALKQFKDVHTYSLDLLVGAALKQWISERCEQRGSRIDEPALHELVLRVGSDLWNMYQEIEKLSAYAQGTSISSDLVQQLVHASFESRIFEFMDAVSKRQRKKTVQLLEDERASGSDDHYLLTMLGRQVRILLSTRSYLDLFPQAKSADIAQAIDIHPFVAQKAIGQARAFQLAELQSAHDLLFLYDVKIKTGRMEAGIAMDLVVNSLLG